MLIVLHLNTYYILLQLDFNIYCIVKYTEFKHRNRMMEILARELRTQ